MTTPQQTTRPPPVAKAAAASSPIRARLVRRTLTGLACALALLTSAQVAAQAPAGPTLAAVKARGAVVCSTAGTTPGFGLYDKTGVLVGLDADTCRAVAAAVFGDPAKARFEVLISAQRLVALATGQVDLTVQQLSWTLTREAANGLEFAGVNFYDGQAFLVRKGVVKAAADLNGASLCITAGSTAEITLSDWARRNHIEYRPIVFESSDQAIRAFDAGRCDGYSTDSSLLAAARTILKDPDSTVILGERISKEPLGPAVRKGDDQWLDIVKWTVFALLNAEELGVTKANVDEMLNSDAPAVRRLLGVEGELGPQMGLDRRWAYNIIKALGNYGELYEKHFGPNTPIDLPRKINSLWNAGGIMFAPPMR